MKIFSLLLAICLMVLFLSTSFSFASMQLDVSRSSTPKPRPSRDFVAGPRPAAAPVVALRSRFHLSRKGEVTRLSPLAPVVVSIGEAEVPINIRINETIGPLLTLIGPGDRPSLARIRVQQLVVERADLKFIVENIEADATLDEEIAIPTVSMRLRPLDLPYWSHPVDLAGRAAIDADKVTFGGTTTSAAGRIAATFEGVAQIGEATGRAQFEIKPIVFAPDELQPTELVPALGDFLTAVRGAISLKGTVRWSEGKPVISGRLLLNDLSFAAGGVSVESLTSAITFERIWPPQTPPGQVLTIARISPGLEVSDGTARFQLDDRGRLRIEHAAFAFSGGTLSVDPLTLDAQADHHNMVFRAESLNLQEVLDAASVEAAHASGSVSGRIPVSLSPSGVAVNHATLAADAPGFLRYQPTVPPGALQQKDEGVALLRNALTNFHYDRFAVTLDGGSSHEWQSTVHIAGNNPDVLDGHPFVLNVNLSVVPGEALVDLGAQRVNVGDTLPLYNALFGLNFLEWLGDRLAAFDALLPSPAD